MRESLGVDLPDSAVTDYFKFTSQADLDDNGDCNEGVACAPKWAVETAAPFDTHELIHAYLSGSGFPPWVFVEGAAVAFSCQVSLFGHPNESSWRDVLGLSRNTNALYAAGGWFVADLIERHGAGDFLRLYQLLNHNADATTIASGFQGVYGISIDEAWSTAMARATAPPSCPWECSQPPLGGSSSGVSPPVCGVEDVQRTFTVPDTTGFVLGVSGPRSVTMGVCGGDVDAPQASEISPRPDGMALVGILEGGSYFLGLDPLQDAASLVFPMPSPVSPQCADATPVDTGSFSVVHVTLPASLTDSYTVLMGPRGNVEVLSDARAAGSIVEICGSCSPTSCIPASPIAIVTTAVSAPYVVHLSRGVGERPFLTATIRSPLAISHP